MQQKRSKPRRKRKVKEKEEEEEEDIGYSRSLTPPPKEEVRPHANRKQSSKDMAPCRLILAEMEKHEDAWPFLVPVNAKQVSKTVAYVTRYIFSRWLIFMNVLIFKMVSEVQR